MTHETRFSGPAEFSFRRTASGACLLAAILAMPAWLSLSGCKSVEIAAPAQDTSAVVKDSATLRITNRIEQNPGSLTFFLFASTAVDFSNAAKAKRLGSVAFQGTTVFRVPAGRWKLAYEDSRGDLFPMQDEASGGLEWLKAIFAKDSDYSLILTSDGNRTDWKPTFQTDPPLEGSTL